MAQFRQDMPPPGGYAPIQYARVPLKKGFLTAKVKVMACLVISGLGWVEYYYYKDKKIKERIEMRCAKLALRPMIEAEVDRALLKHLRKNREWEEKIMKDVKGWEVGKWNHAPVFLTLGPDDFFQPKAVEYYAHLPNDAYDRVLARYAIA